MSKIKELVLKELIKRAAKVEDTSEDDIVIKALLFYISMKKRELR